MYSDPNISAYVNPNYQGSGHFWPHKKLQNYSPLIVIHNLPGVSGLFECVEQSPTKVKVEVKQT